MCIRSTPALHSTSFVWFLSNCKGKENLFWLVWGNRLHKIGVAHKCAPSHTGNVGNPFLGHSSGLWPRLLWNFLHSASRCGKSAMLYFLGMMTSLQQCLRMTWFLEGIQAAQIRLLSHIFTWEAKQCSWPAAGPVPPQLDSLGYVCWPSVTQWGVPSPLHCDWGHVPLCWEWYKTQGEAAEGVGNPRMPFLKQAYPHCCAEAWRISSCCPEMGPRVVRPAICSNLLEC